MADGLQRYQHPGGGAGQFYSNPHAYQYPQRHNVRTGSPVNSSRGYGNDTPSPSRSPVSQVSSHNHYPSYNNGHQQGQNVIVNGGHHQRYVQQGLGNKYQQQQQQPPSYQQQHGQQSHHHQHNHISGPSMGHQHNSSSGTVFNGNSQNNFNNLHNSHTNHGQTGLHDNSAQNPHWQHQLQLAEKSRESRTTPNYHAKQDGVVSLKSKVVELTSASEILEEGDEERTQAVTHGEIARQDWNALDLSGQGLKTITGSLFRYDFLTKLYLDHNHLLNLGPAIGQLRKLTHLDISHNQISELPEEIGMLVNLKELLLFGNGLQTLPAEVGNLFKLETLGIDGNPLDSSLRERIMRDGTKGLISHIRETADGKILLPVTFDFYI